MIILQLVLFCMLFTAMVRYAVRGGAVDGLYFYPRPVRERAIEIGLTTREEMDRKRKIFMTEFYLVMLLALLLIVGAWNHVRDFKTAWLQSLLFLEVMNWYDGIFIDRIWVGRSSFWLLPGCEDIPYVQTWAQVMKKRILLSFVWTAGAAAAAGLVVLIF